MQIITFVEEACLNDMKIMHMQYKNIIFIIILITVKKCEKKRKEKYIKSICFDYFTNFLYFNMLQNIYNDLVG